MTKDQALVAGILGGLAGILGGLFLLLILRLLFSRYRARQVVRALAEEERVSFYEGVRSWIHEFHEPGPCIVAFFAALCVFGTPAMILYVLKPSEPHVDTMRDCSTMCDGDVQHFVRNGVKTYCECETR